MLERSLEIIVRHAYRDLFGSDWSLTAQQMGLPSGRIDLLFQDGADTLHVVELKKGPAVVGALAQVLGYATDLRTLFPGRTVTPWVVAHSIPTALEVKAKAMAVRTSAIPEEVARRLVEKHGLSEADLIGPRRGTGILHGGGSKLGLRDVVDNLLAFREMPPEVASLLQSWSTDARFEIASGGMQTTVWYRGIKLGGVNRRHRGGVAYLAEGVAIGADYENRIERAGFRRMEKTQAGSHHVHVWWETPWSNLEGIRTGFGEACAVVDRVFRVP